MAYSCCKETQNSNIIETDNNGGITKGDTALTYFNVSQLKKLTPNQNQYYLQTLGFIPKNQNCGAKVKVIVYPNPCPSNITPKFKITSDKELISVWFWGDYSPSLTGGRTLNVYEYNEIISENEGSKIYNFLVATSDSCAYEIEWNLVRK
ncbi:MAG: hypothetical protein ACOVOQ_15735 [Flavobacterium sp.]